MDKPDNRKMRIAAALPQDHNPGMSEEICNALFERAADLAYDSFDDVTDDHIEAVYHRLMLNHQWGVGEAGVVTVH
ncbi:MAG: hypothetical protein WBA83_16950 [Burkholderiaceae bacterium]